MFKTVIAPLLNVRDGAKAIAFYKAALGATINFSTPPESGSVVANLSINGAEFWLADESPEHQNFSPESLNGSTVRLILTVDDPDAVFNRRRCWSNRRLARRRSALPLARGSHRRPLRTPLGNRQAYRGVVTKSHRLRTQPKNAVKPLAP